MRKIGILILPVLLWNCSKTEPNIIVELIEYKYGYENEIVLQPTLYAAVDETGVAEVIETIDSANIYAYKTKIKQEVLDELTQEINAKGEQYYKIESSELSLVCFPTAAVRLKVTSRNGKENSVRIGTQGSFENSKFSTVGSFYRFFRQQPRISKVNSIELNELLKKQEAYKKYVFYKDSLEVPPPPPPAPTIDEIIFVKNK